MLVIAVLAALLRPNRPAGGVPPDEASPVNQSQSQPPMLSSPSETSSAQVPLQASFSVTLTGSYPFEVVLPDGVRQSADTHRFVLSAGTTEVRLRNSAYFLDATVSITGTAGEDKSL